MTTMQTRINVLRKSYPSLRISFSCATLWMMMGAIWSSWHLRMMGQIHLSRPSPQRSDMSSTIPSWIRAKSSNANQTDNQICGMSYHNSNNGSARSYTSSTKGSLWGQARVIALSWWSKTSGAVATASLQNWACLSSKELLATYLWPNSIKHKQISLSQNLLTKNPRDRASRHWLNRSKRRKLNRLGRWIKLLKKTGSRNWPRKCRICVLVKRIYV